MKSKKLIQTIVPLVFFLLVSMHSFAIQSGEQEPDDEDFEESELNPPLASVGDYVMPMLVLGIATAFILLRKQNFKNV